MPKPEMSRRDRPDCAVGRAIAFVNTTGVGRAGRASMLPACGALRAGVAG